MYRCRVRQQFRRFLLPRRGPYAEEDLGGNEKPADRHERNALAQRALALARRWFFGSLNDQNDT